MRRSAAGFTLLEMIVVLVIAALIIGVGAGAVAQLTEEHELRKVAHDAEGVIMQAMTRSLATTQPQSVSLEQLAGQARLTLRRAGVEEFVPATEQRLLLRPGGLCEPLTLRWQKGPAWVSATLDPLTGGFAETEESL
ncbi:MAG: prepilin-type N-terminal cleavage/methylation domain-containing protein [Verrucomicrobiota bacterium]|jgi:prepilin-type N-terminal cleavage/methylation domain-containing protein|nr:prepilin-type N-terminal cleavage/methylation domain-containing protein [Verrucomicrobiota bacterium]